MTLPIGIVGFGRDPGQLDDANQQTLYHLLGLDRARRTFIVAPESICIINTYSVHVALVSAVSRPQIGVNQARSHRATIRLQWAQVAMKHRVKPGRLEFPQSFVMRAAYALLRIECLLHHPGPERFPRRFPGIVYVSVCGAGLEPKFPGW